MICFEFPADIFGGQVLQVPMLLATSHVWFQLGNIAILRNSWHVIEFGKILVKKLLTEAQKNIPGIVFFRRNLGFGSKVLA